MPTPNQRRFPTLQTPSKCSPNHLFCENANSSGSREQELFSPPTLPYTFENVVENMNRSSDNSFGSGSINRSNPKDSPHSIGSSTNIFTASPTSAGSSKASPSSSNKRSITKPRINPFCNGSYGLPKANTQVAVEDVIRWKEFRRRQKEQSEETNDLPNLDSLSLSASNSSSGEKARDSSKTKEDSPRAMEIDQDGFPASPSESDAQPKLTLENVEMASNISEAATEVASNTLFSRLLASTEKIGGLGSICETVPSDTMPADPTVGISSGGRKQLSLRIATSSPNAAAPLATPKASSTAPPSSTRSISSAMSTRTQSSTPERFGGTRRSTSSTEEWDDPMPTLDVDALNESVEENKNDVSTVSSNWDPLHVSTVVEESGSDDDSGKDEKGSCNDAGKSKEELDESMSSFNIHGEMGADDDNVAQEEELPAATEQNAKEESPLKPSPDPLPTSTTDKSTSTFKLLKPPSDDPSHTCTTDKFTNEQRPPSPLSCCSVPTLTEVKSFMNKLNSLREEQRIHHANRSRPTTATCYTDTTGTPQKLHATINITPLKPPQSSQHSPPGVEIKEENVDYLRTLLEKKEKLRIHKLETQRKRNELDERLRAMRSKVYGENDTSMETTSTAVAQDGDAKDAEEKDKAQKEEEVKVPMMPGARWSGGLARWSSPAASPSTTPEKGESLKEAIPYVPTDLSKDAKSDQVQKPQETETANQRLLREPDWIKRKKIGESSTASKQPLHSPLYKAVVSMTNIGAASSSAAKPLPNASLTEALNKVAEDLDPMTFKSPLHKTVEGTSGNDVEKSNAKLSSPQKASQFASPKKVASKIATLSVAFEKDDFSFKPNALNSKQIPFSPLVVGKLPYVPMFSFSSSQDINKSSSNLSASADLKSSPLSEVTNSTSQSPDVSEGDKGGGLGFGYMSGDKSVVSKSSSRFVELGQVDSSPKESEDKEEHSLVGVTVVGSKEKKYEKRRKLDSPQFGADDEQSKSSYRESEESPKNMAPDPPGVESRDVWQKNIPNKNVPEKNASSKHSKKPSRDLTVDCSLTNDLAATLIVSTENDEAQISISSPQTRSTKPTLLSPVVESTTENDFDSVMQRVKAISTPRSTLETPRAANTASLKSPKFRADRENKISKVSSTIDALKSKFESEGVEVSPMKDTNMLSPRSGGWTKPKSSFVKPFGMELFKTKEVNDWTKPTSAFIDRSKSNPIYESNLHPTLSDVKEELTQVESMDNSSVSSFKGLNIKELRSRFEGSKDSHSVGSIKSFKSRDLGINASLESDMDNCCDDGDNSLDTKKVLFYAQRIEQKAKDCEPRDYHPEVSKTTEAGSGETENSAKENMLEQAVDEVFPHFSPVTIQKKAFESGKKQVTWTAGKPLENDRDVLQDAVLICHKVNTLSEEIEAKPVVTSKQQSTPRLSVRERVAKFNSPNAVVPTSNIPGGYPPVKKHSQVVPFQKLMTPPPKIVQMNQNQTPSPLWAHNGSMFSPMDTIGAPKPQNAQRQRHSAPYALRGQSMNKVPVNSPAIQQPQRNAAPRPACSQNQPSTIQASYDSPGLSQGDDDYDDGITLSPTFSEVSGLTLPTCIGSVADDNSRNSRHSRSTDIIQEAMSPIARHRQKNGATTNGNLFNHPYLKRMIAQNLPNASTQKAKGQQPIQNQRSHREQILSRVASSPRRTQAAASSKPPQPISVNLKPSPGRNKRMSQNPPTVPTAASTKSHQSPSRTKHAGKGKVAERVAMVNERTQRANDSSRRNARQSEDLSSAATRDCLRVN